MEDSELIDYLEQLRQEAGRVRRARRQLSQAAAEYCARLRMLISELEEDHLGSCQRRAEMISQRGNLADKPEHNN